MGIITIIIVILVFLAIVGLGVDTFFAGVMKGADEPGITPLVSNITSNADDIIQNLTRDGENRVLNST
jgi:flagellar basal body-associated protein FliL